MHNLLSHIPGYNLYEYILILKPHEDLCNRIIEIKKEFSEKYKLQSAFFSKPNITLVKFTQLQIAEERILNNLKKIAMAYHQFKIDLKNFGSYPAHSIFININSQLQLKNLVTEIKTAQQLMKLDKDNKPHFIDEPNITIAQKLKPWQYEQAWTEYAQRHFTGSFITDALFLLKRKKDEKSYRLVQKFEFMNLPAITKQGALFS